MTQQAIPISANAATHFTLTINGITTLVKDIAPTTTLLQYLRQQGYVGTKEGCGDGDCGACTVAIAGKDAQGKPQYQAANSCLIPIGAVAGRDVITAEGLAHGQPHGLIQAQSLEQLHPVQAAMVETAGSQCGYCTPGFIMSMFAAYYDGGLKDDVCIEGNLCRCTGYLPIRRAAQKLLADLGEESPSDRFSTMLTAKNSDLAAIAYSSNEHRFYRPTELTEALQLLQAHPDATLVAGATDLGLEMSWHRRNYPVLISLEGITELKQIHQTEDYVKIGAAVPLSHIENVLHGIFPSLDEMLHWFAARQVRNRATLGGNIGTASPIGDLPPVLLALDATVTLASIQGDRTLPLADFFKGYRQTELQQGEIIKTVTIPKAISKGATKRLSFSYKIGKRGTDDISIVAAAFAIDLDAEQKILHARLAYGGVAATPIRAIAVEQALIGQPWNLETVRSVKPMLHEAFTPLSDLRGSANYRKLLVGNLFEKFFIEQTS
ncbi:xanthine dehydrogenase small subunit [Pseudanabaena cinerea]|uniref:xanthine dehydrogenase small subunit n=1 Tax=Pseudanabaena cinerea TaxID=2661616 RepID=UPI002AC33DC7|nr:xanthine dehydrogenase small subunit [Pseudanabaena cinerea]